ncbi:MAG: DUF924 family protein [Rhizobiaceae bacterium]
MEPQSAHGQQQLGLVILLDQLPRNAFRGSAQAYATDAAALAVCRRIAASGPGGFKLIERLFLILPFGHSESLEDQDRSLALAEEHYFPFAAPDHFFTQASRQQSALYRDIIARFGRFPHRNAILGRETTDEEAQFMAETKPSPV